MVNTKRGVFTTLDEFPIYNFYNCYKGKLNYIFKSREGDLDDDVLCLWESLLDQYHEITSNYKNISFYNLIMEVKWLENRLVYAPLLLDLVIKTPKDDRINLFNELRKWKLPIKSINDVEKCIEILNNSRTKLQRKLAEIEEHKNRNEKLKSKEMSLQKQAIKIERNLGVKPDIFRDSVTTWISYFEEIEELSRKNNG